MGETLSIVCCNVSLTRLRWERWWLVRIILRVIQLCDWLYFSKYKLTETYQVPDLTTV